ncbi:MAG: hypothetical protein KAT34_13285 [Candidatus Aminicenantes bacterium]|nr:hypothetical protein [Candidatus Aminicenantes bacterium]
MTKTKRFNKTILISLIIGQIVFIRVLLCRNNYTQKISLKSGNQLLRVIEFIGISGMQNGEELVFHLCQLSKDRLVNKTQKQAIQDYLKTLSIRIDRKNQKVREFLSNKKKDNYAYQNEYRNAKLLYRLAAASLLSSLVLEKDDLILPKNTRNIIQELFPELILELPGYKLLWKELIDGEELYLDAIPIRYGSDGFRSFLLIYSKGVIMFFSGDFKGGVVDLNDMRKTKIHFSDFFNTNKILKKIPTTCH